MSEHSEIIVKLFFETREEAEEAAAEIVTEGLEAEVERSSMGNAWSITLTGPDELVEGLSERLLREMNVDPPVGD